MPMTTVQLLALHDDAKQLRGVLKDYDAAVKAALEDAGGVVRVGDQEAYFQERTTKAIDFHPVLLDYVGTLEEVATVGNGKLKDAIKAKAKASGKKIGATIDECMEALAEAGAITESVSRSIAWRDVEEV